MKVQSQRGVALVVTLIMLSVITFLTVAFLAITRRDKASMTTSSSQTDAKLASDVALARAQSEIIAQIVSKTNMLVGDLLLSRNFVNPAGYNPAVNTNSLDNVNYEFRSNDRQPLAGIQQIENLYNLFYDPRPPVYVATNEAGSNDFRYYYDWNRNRRPDTNGLVPVIVDEAGTTNGTFVSAIGDPEFIGILEKPEYRHSGTNRFPSRYAYIVLPEGNSLDINYIHNYSRFNGNMNSGGDGFFRNQGVGSWEISLAGLLSGLNTNYYGASTNGYTYDPFTPASPNLGSAFEDALDILSYRYRTNKTTSNLPSAVTTLGTQAATEFQNDQIDQYANGPLQTNYISITDNNDAANEPWPGSKNTNAFFDIGDLFNAGKSSPAFVARLAAMGARTNSYDRYSFQRLMSQIGTHSTPATNVVIAGKNYRKLNVNYNNIKSTNRFEPWTAVEFFTNAAELMIQKSLQRVNPNFYELGGIRVPTNFGIANIEIYPNNRYTPALHRLLQVAANVYVASNPTNINTAAVGLTNAFPYVFRPKFSVSGTNIIISGYEEVTSTNAVNGPYLDLAKPTDRGRITSGTSTNVFGVPWVISAKKGMPNFNEFSLETDTQVTRRLQLRKNASYKIIETNQMYTISINNRVGFEFWNSYTQAFPFTLTVLATNQYVAALTNELGAILTNSWGYPNYTNTIAARQQFGPLAPAAIRGTPQGNSFIVVTNPLAPAFLPNSQYTNHPGGPYFKPATNSVAAFDRGRGFYIPDWDLVMTNRIVCALIAEGRVIDFVNIDNIVTTIDITSELYGNRLDDPTGNNLNVWRTNRFGGGTSINTPTDGIIRQLDLSIGQPRVGDDVWAAYSSPSSSALIDEQIADFRRFVGLGSSSAPPLTNLTWMAPFSPVRRFYQKTSFEVNDPMVHHMAGDLISAEVPVAAQTLLPNQALPESKLGKLNDRYKPWGGNRTPGLGGSDSDDEYKLEMRDPQVRWSDDWDFPTNKFASIGWLGRVHRGTPWQSMYLKSAVASTNDWFKWAGSHHTHPTNDWFLLDIFTAAPNDNAARGLLSVNQAGTAAWSAVLSGVMALSNSAPSVGNLSPLKFDPVVIDPTVGTNIQMIVDGINRDRADTNRHPDGVYSTLGEVLAAPELTVASPFLNRTGNQPKHGINDAAYERIPQQILSLLKTGEARFVVYAIGQSLKPAPNSFVFEPGYQNMCTNYQITGEVAARAVMRVEGSPQNPKVIIESYSILPEE